MPSFTKSKACRTIWAGIIAKILESTTNKIPSKNRNRYLYKYLFKWLRDFTKATLSRKRLNVFKWHWAIQNNTLILHPNLQAPRLNNLAKITAAAENKGAGLVTVWIKNKLQQVTEPAKSTKTGQLLTLNCCILKSITRSLTYRLCLTAEHYE